MPVPDRKRRLTAFVVAMAVLIATPLAVVATDTFTDVPESNVHHDNITWLSDTGVTAGCNPPDNDEYCPNENVTRAQMATFIRRLSENEIVNAATANEADHAATADSVNGIELHRFFFQAEANTTDAEIGTFGPITLRATCDAGGDPFLRASWNETVNHLTFNGATASQFGNATVDANDVIGIGNGQFGGVGLVEAVGFDSHVHTSVEFFVRPTGALGENMCMFSGFVTIG
jgi:hypothetical protein